ncbi:MAG: hypothetical protein RSC68_09970 [Acinetobacter sp.]
MGWISCCNSHEVAEKRYRQPVMRYISIQTQYAVSEQANTSTSMVAMTLA